jgi:hypothetical protein
MLALALGTVDAAYMFYEWALANKAAYWGARTAIVSNPVASNLANISYTATQQQQLGQLCFGPTTGTVTNCPSIGPVHCVSGSCDGTGSTYDSAAFTHILTAMQTIFPRIAASNVQITYSTNGLGFVGQPYSGSSDFTNPHYTLPMNVTVSITGMTHQFFFIQGLLRFFGGGVSTKNIPPFSTTLQSQSIFTQ